MLKRLAIASLFVILLVPFGGYWSWPYWAPAVLRAFAADYSVEITRVAISRPTFNSVTISDLVAQHLDTGSSLRAPLLEIKFQPLLLLRGELDSLLAPQVDIDVQVAPAPPTARPGRVLASPALPVVLPAVLLSRLPLSRLVIDNLRVNAPLPGDYGRLGGRLRLGRDELAVNLRGETAAAPELTLLLNRENAIQATIQSDGTPVVRLEGSVTETGGEQQFAGELEVALEAAAGLLQPFGLVPAGAQFAGQLRADWQLPLPEAIAGEELQRLQLAGQFNSSGTIRVTDALDSSEFRLRGAFRLTAAELLVRAGEIHLSGSRASPAALVDLHPEPGTTPLAIVLAINPGAQIRVARATGQVAADAVSGRLVVGRSDGGLSATIEFDDATVNQDEEWSATANFSAAAEIGRLSKAAWSAGPVRITTAGALSLGAGIIRIAPTAPIVVTATNMIKDNYSIPLSKVTCNDISGLAISLQSTTIDSAKCMLGDHRVNSPPLHIELPRGTLKLQDMTLAHADPAQSSAAISGHLEAITLRREQFTLLPISLDANMALRGAILSGTFTAANGDELLKTEGTFSHDLGTGAGQLTASTHSVVLANRDAYLPRIIAPLPVPVDVTSGRFQVDSTLAWDGERTEIDSKIELQDIAGFYRRNVFHGMHGTLQLRSDTAGISVTGEELRIDGADAGIQATNIRFGLALKNSTLVVSDFRSELLGGEISQKHIEYDWSRPENHVVVDLHGIQLAEVLNLERGITGTGSLGGQLPFIITDSGVRIEHGGISARSPGGIIRYVSDAPVGRAATGAGLQLTLDALRNFHYHVLTAQVAYSAAGDLTLKVMLQGRNPDLKEKRPFHFNLTLTENIPMLLKSLQLTRKISDDLDRRIKGFYSTKPQGTPQ